MPLYTAKWRARFRWFKVSIIPIFLELALTFASFRLAALLITNQNYFDTHRPNYDWIMAGFFGSEWRLGALALVAASLKAIGIAIMLLRRWPVAVEAAFFLRQLGWGLSVMLWGGIALSLTFGGDTSSIGSITTIGFCMFSVMGMIMGPVMPDGPHEPE